MATGFPAGQTPLETRLEEIDRAIKDGATEIDIVISRKKALTGDWKGLPFLVFSMFGLQNFNLDKFKKV